MITDGWRSDMREPIWNSDKIVVFVQWIINIAIGSIRTFGSPFFLLKKKREKLVEEKRDACFHTTW